MRLFVKVYTTGIVLAFVALVALEILIPKIPSLGGLGVALWLISFFYIVVFAAQSLLTLSGISFYLSLNFRGDLNFRGAETETFGPTKIGDYQNDLVKTPLVLFQQK